MASLLNMSGRGLLEKLPYDYEVEYLESTGTQWIVGISDHFYDFEVKFYVPTDAPNVVMGIDNYNKLERLNAQNPYISIIVNNNRYLSDVIIYGTHIVSYKDGDIVIDGVYKSNMNNPCVAGNNKLFGAVNRNYKQRIYYCKLFNDSKLILSLVPVVKDNVGYMYDKVSKQLFGNAGTDSFIIGPRV